MSPVTHCLLFYFGPNNTQNETMTVGFDVFQPPRFFYLYIYLLHCISIHVHVHEGFKQEIPSGLVCLFAGIITSWFNSVPVKKILPFTVCCLFRKKSYTCILR